LGTCTHYLCSLAELNVPEIPVYIHPSHDFKPPVESERAIIMIGPGTGVAPFRAFMQERVFKGHTGHNWLFFGEWTRKNEFFYEEDWLAWSEKDLLKLSLAFSRDQEAKVYVQHRMMEHAKELYKWIEEGAYLYVCGDAHHMAKDVEKTLHTILMQEAHLTESEAHDYIKRLRKEKRYLRDVY
jgi:sulfite reductase (NADPH) flavoprotein alpha-component